MAKYAFIIPVYNVEQYLRQCVDSILAQTYHDYTIVLVDDGSSDGSGKICDSYAEKNEQITVVHQENKGLSEARNVGVRSSASEYIIFLDSDDYWFDTEGLKKIDALTEKKPDIIIFASKGYSEKDKSLWDDRYDYPEILNDLSPEMCLEYMIRNDLFNISACKRVIRRDFFIENNLFFLPGIKSEDIEAGIRTAGYLPRYQILNEKLYVYRHRSNSISTTVGEKHLNDYVGIIEECAEAEYGSDRCKELLLSYVGYQLALALAYITNVHSSNRKELINRLRKYSYLWNYTEYPRTGMINRFYKLFGFNLTRIALGLYLKS